MPIEWRFLVYREPGPAFIHYIGFGKRLRHCRDERRYAAPSLKHVDRQHLAYLRCHLHRQLGIAVSLVAGDHSAGKFAHAIYGTVFDWQRNGYPLFSRSETDIAPTYVLR